MKLRLLKVLVQPVFVLDDGEFLTEQVADLIVVSPKDWLDYPRNEFAEAVERYRQQMEGEPDANTNR